MKKVLVLGCGSFSGSHFVDVLLEKGEYEVIGVNRSVKKDLFLPYMKRKSEHFSFHQLHFDKDMDELLALLDKEKPEYVVNFASQSMVGQSWDYPEDWYQTNVLSLVHFCNELRQKEWLKKYVHISTPEVYGSLKGSVKEDHPFNPTTPYAASRAAGDTYIQLLVKTYGFPAVFTRAANVFGEGQQLFRIIPRSIIYMKMGKKIPLHGGGYAKRAFIHIRDVCEATITIMEEAKPGEIYHLSTPELIAIRDLVGLIAERMGKSFEEVTEAVKTRLGLDDAYNLDSSKAKNDFDWEPKISLDDGLQEVIDWVDSNWDVIVKEPLEYVHKE